ncbi:MAG TPA: hypothetical protein VIJ41_07810 [Candidatus Nanopelagicales bacterium]
MVSIHRRIPSRRRTAAALVATATALLLGPSLVPAAAAASPLQAGLFGDQDPTYDGVFRQSLGLLAYAAVGETPPADAVSWLLGQQCPDGGFQAFRPVASDPCQKSDPIAYAGEDTNSTGIAAAALRAIGQPHAADRALAWAAGAQNSDGGFPYFVGGSSDANSTAVVLFGTNTAGRPPASVAVGGVSAADFLVGLQLGCAGAATDDDGGFAFQDYGSGLLDNDAASVQAVLALSGAALPVTPRTVSTSVPRADCTTSPPPSTTAGPAELGAGHLARVLDAFSGAIPQFDYSSGARVPGSVSAGDTAWAAMSLAAVGIGRSQLDAALGVLGAAPTTAAGVRTGRVADAAAAAATADQPGQLALVALAARAGGAGVATVAAFVARIGATMRLAPAATAPSPSSSSTAPSAPSSAAPSASSSATPSGSPTRSASASPSVSPTSSASPSSSDLGALSPTGATPLTPVLGVLGATLLLAGLGLLATARRRSAHA